MRNVVISTINHYFRCIYVPKSGFIKTFRE